MEAPAPTSAPAPAPTSAPPAPAHPIWNAPLASRAKIGEVARVDLTKFTLQGIGITKRGLELLGEFSIRTGQTRTPLLRRR